MIQDEHFNPHRPDVCQFLRWKGMFVTAPDDPTVPRSGGGLFWCNNTQTCLGPDGQVANPGNCCSGTRSCYGKGQVG